MKYFCVIHTHPEADSVYHFKSEKSIQEIESNVTYLCRKLGINFEPFGSDYTLEEIDKMSVEEIDKLSTTQEEFLEIIEYNFDNCEII